MVAMAFRSNAAWLATSALLVALLAGCLAGDPDPDPVGDDDDASMVEPWAVVALVDTGINPYHVDFRLQGERADVHPSKYIPGYPADIPTVNLSLDEEDLEKALEKDEAQWDSLESHQPYWFNGTRVTGIAVTDNPDDDDVGFVFSTGHGTMVASKAGGGAYSLCPTCHIVGVQGFNGEAVTWASEQAWIDVQSNSWGPTPAFAWADPVLEPVLGNDPDLNKKMQAAAKNQGVFVAAGNGIGGGGGVLGNPSPTDSTSGPPGVIAVGGNDNGRVTLWTAWVVHVVADACWNWSAVGGTTQEYSPRAGGGTSAASPYTSGAAARMILEARAVLGSTTPRDLETGVLAQAPANHTVPGSGPLSDGSFTLEELKQVLFRTASAMPRSDDASGDVCPIESPAASLIQWGTLPDETPRYAWVGYGSVEAHSLERALSVLAGENEIPQRNHADMYYEQDQQIREAYHSVP